MPSTPVETAGLDRGAALSGARHGDALTVPDTHAGRHERRGLSSHAGALDLPCPFCGTQMYAEQAHNRCPSCLYIEPCCDGAPQPCRLPAAEDAATA
jgi:hypothetical protein